ncbi:MAG TPA: hypothetical protein VK964_18545 [Nocardioidaceae bacterium]|nr:hypothetical protein [Nocardioidaceae bacterium]
MGVPAARTAATVVLFGVGIAILALLVRPVDRLEAILLTGLVTAFTVLMVLPAARTFFALSTLPPIVWVSLAGLIAVAALALTAVWWFSLRLEGPEESA